VSATKSLTVASAASGGGCTLDSTSSGVLSSTCSISAPPPPSPVVSWNWAGHAAEDAKLAAGDPLLDRTGPWFAASERMGVTMVTAAKHGDDADYGLLAPEKQCSYCAANSYLKYTLSVVGLSSLSAAASVGNGCDSNDRDLLFEYSFDDETWSDIAASLSFGTGGGTTSGNATFSPAFTGTIFARTTITGSPCDPYVTWRKIELGPVATTWSFVPTDPNKEFHKIGTIASIANVATDTWLPLQSINFNDDKYKKPFQLRLFYGPWATAYGFLGEYFSPVFVNPLFASNTQGIVSRGSDVDNEEFIFSGLSHTMNTPVIKGRFVLSGDADRLVQVEVAFPFQQPETAKDLSFSVRFV